MWSWHHCWNRVLWQGRNRTPPSFCPSTWPTETCSLRVCHTLRLICHHCCILLWYWISIDIHFLVSCSDFRSTWVSMCAFSIIHRCDIAHFSKFLSGILWLESENIKLISVFNYKEWSNYWEYFLFGVRSVFCSLIFEVCSCQKSYKMDQSNFVNFKESY